MSVSTKCPKCGDETNDGHPGGPCGRDMSEEFPGRGICDGETETVEEEE